MCSLTKLIGLFDVIKADMTSQLEGLKLPLVWHGNKV